MRWAHPQPFRIQGWIVMDGAGGGFMAIRISDHPGRANVVCADDADALRRGVARAEGITTPQLADRQPSRRAHLRGVG
jgi:hypothetical protein